MLCNSFLVLAHRETLQSSPAADKDVATSRKSSSPVRDLGTNPKRDDESDQRSASPSGKRASPVTVRQPGSQYPPKPPRLTPSPTPSISPLVKRRKAEAGRTSPALKLNIPTILVEDEPMETECDPDRSRSRRAEGRVRKSKKGRSHQPRSPEEGTGFSFNTSVTADFITSSKPDFWFQVDHLMTPTSQLTMKQLKRRGLRSLLKTLQLPAVQKSG